MLVLTRKLGEKIKIITELGEEVELYVVQIKGKQVRVGVKASRKTRIHRGEFIGDDGKCMSREQYADMKLKKKAELEQEAKIRMNRNKNLVGLLK